MKNSDMPRALDRVHMEPLIFRCLGCNKIIRTGRLLCEDCQRDSYEPYNDPLPGGYDPECDPPRGSLAWEPQGREDEPFLKKPGTHKPCRACGKVLLAVDQERKHHFDCGCSREGRL